MRAVPSAVTPPTVACIAVLAAVWWEEGRDAALSLATGYTAAALLVVTLLVSPVHRLRRGSRPPVHLPLRRSLGVHAGLVALVHMVVSFPVHLGGDVPRFFLDEDGRPLVDRFGLSNWVGLVAVGAFVVLLVTSTDGAIRRLGARRWKALHRIVWLAAALSFLHTIGYQDIRDASVVSTLALVVGTAGLLGIRLAGSHARTHRG